MHLKKDASQHGRTSFVNNLISLGAMSFNSCLNQKTLFIIESPSH